MLQVLSRTIPLSPDRESAIASKFPQILDSFTEFWSLQTRISFDTRGYEAMLCILSGKETPLEELTKLATNLATTNAEAIAYTAKISPSNIMENAELCIKTLKSELPLICLDRFRLAVIEVALETNPLMLDAARLGKTLLDIGEKIGAVKAAEVTANLVLPPLGVGTGLTG